MGNEGPLKLTLESIKELVDELVDEKLLQILKDPDEGLELREEIKNRLRRSLKSQEDGERGVLLENVMKSGLISKCVIQ